MLPHQLAVLKKELARPEYAGLSGEALLSALNQPDVLKRLCRTRFLPQSVWDGLRQKDRDRMPLVGLLPDAEAEAFAYVYGQAKDGSGGQKGWDIPGFPNKIRREDLAALGA